MYAHRNDQFIEIHLIQSLQRIPDVCIKIFGLNNLYKIICSTIRD